MWIYTSSSATETLQDHPTAFIHRESIQHFVHRKILVTVQKLFNNFLNLILRLLSVRTHQRTKTYKCGLIMSRHNI